MPKRFEQLLKKKPMKRVSKIKEIFKICFALLNDKDVVVELTTLIEWIINNVQPKKRVNHIEKN